MTPEERAKALLAAIADRGTGGWRFEAEMEDALPLIAQAITQAENDKLEEAAAAAIGASRGMSCFVGLDDCQHFNQGVRAAEQAVLALKKD